MRLHLPVTLLAVAAVATGCVGQPDPVEPTPSQSDNPIESATALGSEPTDDPSPSPTTPAAPIHESDGQLTLGILVPRTGRLASFGRSLEAATALALDEINAAGGVLESDVVFLDVADETDDQATVAAEAARLIDEGADGIIGPASSTQVLAAIDTVVQAGVTQCSGSATTPILGDYDDGGLFVRTAPTDVLQGPLLADIIDGDGLTTVAIIARGDAWGLGVRDALVDALDEADIDIAASIVYDVGEAIPTSFDDSVQELAAAEADGIVVLSFAPEGAQILRGLIDAEVAANVLYGADGLLDAQLARLVDPAEPERLAGMQGTGPKPVLTDDFLSRLRTQGVGIADNDPTVRYAAETYDCVILMALAAHAANSDVPADIASMMIELSQGIDSCSGFVECRDLIDQGKPIDYVGASGPVDLDARGEPIAGNYVHWRVSTTGDLEELRERPVPESLDVDA